MARKKTGLQKELMELIFAFVIAWVVYQLLSLVIGTSMPIVSVVSDSMYHTSHFDQWWEDNGNDYAGYNITKDRFRTFTSPAGLSRGDLLVVGKATDLKVGDILIYNKFGSDFTIVHRLVETQNDAYIVKGDNNNQADPAVNKEYAAGKVILAIPLLGYPRLALHLIGI